MAGNQNTGTLGGGLSPKVPSHGLPGGAIKSKSKGRLVFKIIMVVLALLGIGGGIALYFILTRKPKPKGVDLSVDVWMIEYPSDTVTYKNTYKFKPEDKSMVYGEKDEMEAEMTGSDFRVEILYGVFNNKGKMYTYTFRFDQLVIENCIVKYYIDSKAEQYDIPENGQITVQRSGNFSFVVVITLDKLEWNAECSGNITMDISLV